MASRQALVVLGLGVIFPAPLAAQPGLGDPTRPTQLNESRGDAKNSAAPWRLQSTLLADDRRVAVINGQTLREGQSIDGARLLEVRSDRVVLGVEGGRLTLHLVGDAPDVKRGRHRVP